MRRLALAAVLAGCTTFENPDIVIDLRVLAMTGAPPEQVVDVDLEAPPQPAELLGQLAPATMCALVADPAFERRLRYRLTLCRSGLRGRCDDPVVPLASGIIEDPETSPVAPRMCASVEPNGNLLGILLATAEDDPLAALGGIDYLVQLEVGGEGADPALDLFASKSLRVSPRIPAFRTANVNPTLDAVEATLGEAAPVPLELARCVEQAAPVEVAPGTRLRLTPIETEGARERYAVPTLDGNVQVFTESLTYQWIASAGGFSSGSTGGPRDAVGNTPELFTEWRAPPARELAGPTDVALWFVQRDERLGSTWYESCVRVVP